MLFSRLRLVVMCALLLSIAACDGLPRPYEVVTAIEMRDIILRQSKRDRAVMIHVWATWNEASREEFRLLNRLDEEYRDQGLTIIGLSVDSPDSIKLSVRPFAENLGVDFPIVVMDASDPMFLRKLHSALAGKPPETILFNKDGIARVILRGEQNYNQYREALSKVL